MRDGRECDASRICACAEQDTSFVQEALARRQRTSLVSLGGEEGVVDDRVGSERELRRVAEDGIDLRGEKLMGMFATHRSAPQTLTCDGVFRRRGTDGPREGERPQLERASPRSWRAMRGSDARERRRRWNICRGSGRVSCRRARARSPPQSPGLWSPQATCHSKYA